MSSVKCHFDGKVFVPDEPVDLPVGQPLRMEIEASVVFTGGPGITVGEFVASTKVGGWPDIMDPTLDSLEIAAELRKKSSQPSYHKQRAFFDMYEDWDEAKLIKEEPDSGSRS